MDLAFSTTQRGFAQANFLTGDGVACSIQKSSVMGTDAIWLGVDDPDPKVLATKAASVGVTTSETTGWVPYPIPDEVLISTRMHLTRDEVKALLPLLQHFAETGEVPMPKNSHKN